MVDCPHASILSKDMMCVCLSIFTTVIVKRRINSKIDLDISVLSEIHGLAQLPAISIRRSVQLPGEMMIPEKPIF